VGRVAYFKAVRFQGNRTKGSNLVIKKKLVFSAVLAVAMLPIQVNASDAFSGFYAGGSIGVFSGATFKFTDRDSGNSETYGIEDPVGRIDLRAGYGLMVAEKVYLGGELGLTVHNGVSGEAFRDNVDEFRGVIEAGDGFAVKGILGYAATPTTLLYGTIGYQERDYELDLRWAGGSFSFAEETFSGFGFGFGMRQELRERLALTAEVFRTSYSAEDDATWDARYDVTDVQFDIGLVYRF
jgi:hypothetical protein